jgi:predicted acyl esterase
MGISYGGFTSLQVASHAPEHLTSIILSSQPPPSASTSS